MAKQEPREGEQQLIAQMLAFADDPLQFVLYTFPWQKPNSPLEHHHGPRQWQLEALQEMRDHIARNRNRTRQDLTPELLKIAIASGRGIGKSAFLAWVALWLFSTVPSSTVIVSANTEQQLKSTTFPEIRKWATMAINANWFEHNAMSLRPAEWLIHSLKTTTDYDDAYWYIQARLWSEETPDAFAGVHSHAGMAVLFDEASGIPAPIWPVTEGYFTDPTVHRFWVAISNPRNPSGTFFECFNANRDAWWHRTVDARTVNENDQALYAGIIKQYGEDSDEARVEVYGMFPRQGDENFLSRGEVEDAVAREVEPDIHAPLIMGVDPARMGRDKAVIAFRQGRDARSIEPLVYPKTTTAELAEHCAAAIEKYKPDAVMIEADGIGGPVIELLERMGYQIISVMASSTASDPERYYLHRTEIWGRFKEWLPSGSLPDHKELVVDLCGMRYRINLKGQLALWSKDQMRAKGFASPDYADAYMMTFSRTIARGDAKTSRRSARRRVAAGMDYDLFA